jgi:hypothetical protein
MRVCKILTVSQLTDSLRYMLAAPIGYRLDRIVRFLSVRIHRLLVLFTLGGR